MAAKECYDADFSIEIPNEDNEDHYVKNVLKTEFEQICKPLFDRMMIPLKDALTSAGLQPD